MSSDKEIDWRKRWRKFIEKYYHENLLNSVKKGEKSLVIDYSKIARADLELAEELLENPEEIIEEGEESIEDFDLDVEDEIRVRINNIPDSQELLINEIRSKHLGKLISTTGLIRQTSDVRPRITLAKFECPSCGEIIPVEQREKKLTPPARCPSCGRKGRFKLHDKKLVDVQRMVLEETPESLVGGEQPKRIPIFLSEDLLAPELERRRYPGNKVEITGVVKEVPVRVKSGARSTTYDLIIDGNYVDTVQEEFEEIKLNEEDKERIKELARDDEVYEKLINSVAPSIYGHTNIKEAIVLQLFGGVQKVRADESKTRGDIHIFLVGDPGSGKSEILRSVSELAPKARYIAGKGATGAGLCVSPNSMVPCNPGEMHEIGPLVEQNLESEEEFKPGIWREEAGNQVKVQNLSRDFDLESSSPSHMWRLKSPKRIFEVTTSKGKKIELTGNTRLLSAEGGELKWRKSMDIDEGDYVATPRRLSPGKCEKQPIVDLIESNPIIYGVKSFIKELKEPLAEKYGSLRKAAKEIRFSENNLYHHWVKKGARGNIKVGNFRNICTDLGVEWKDKVKTVSLCRGKRHKIPSYLNSDFLYVAGLIAGDGDIRESGEGGTYSVRLSNSNKKLRNEFIKVIEEQFDLNYDIQKGKKGKRPTVVRTNSKILGEILLSLGIPFSPKSSKLALSNTLLKLSNDLLSDYLAGLYDADGSVYYRGKGKGSDCIGLTTASEKLARQLQLVLLRFGINPKLRSRKANPNSKINNKHRKWVLEIREKEDIQRFSKSIFLRHPVKRRKLKKITEREQKPNTNVDIIPKEVNLYLKEVLESNNISLKKVGWRKNLSKEALQKLLSKVNLKDEEASRIKKMAEGDVFWERVTAIREKESPYEYVYDLTVDGAHNFVVDGILTHNTASVVKDEFISGWTLEAGALVLANHGIVMVDEMDKMSAEDRSAMHEALEQQIITISKATIQATLKAQTSVLGAANPKFGRFDPYSPVPSQIELPPTLINRFDLIFTIRDIPDSEIDSKIASHVLDMHKDPKSKTPELNTDLLRKYIAYAKRNCKPKLTKAAFNKIKKFYVDLRSAASTDAAEVTSVPISARQLEALIRLAEASAKVRLSKKVRKKDAERAIRLLKSCMKEVAIDTETGRFDIDKVAVGITGSQRSRITVIRKAIEGLTEKLGKTIPISDLMEKAEEEGIDKTKAEEILEELKKKGDIFEPKPGFVQKVG